MNADPKHWLEVIVNLIPAPRTAKSRIELGPASQASRCTTNWVTPQSTQQDINITDLVSKSLFLPQMLKLAWFSQKNRKEVHLHCGLNFTEGVSNSLLTAAWKQIPNVKHLKLGNAP